MRFALLLALPLGLLASPVHAADKVAADVAMKGPDKLKKGSSGELAITISAREGWKLSLEAPLSIKLSAPGNLSLKKTKLGVNDAAPDKAKKNYSFPTTVTGTASGAAKVEANITYFMCTEEVCKRFKAKKEVALQVK
ncbi:MAG: hypothetical protein CMH55_00210 [Myxococcales bacterium]|nr:hypothetical protein [Myxococcales bacterium]